VKDNIAKIRAALELARDYITSDLASERGAFEGYEGVSRIGEIKADLTNNEEALAALAELERAAAEPVTYQYSHPSGAGKVFGLGSTYASQLCRRFGFDQETGKELPKGADGNGESGDA